MAHGGAAVRAVPRRLESGEVGQHATHLRPNISETPSVPRLTPLRIVAHSVRGGGRVSRRAMGTSDALLASDEKVANRNAKVWHGATENGP